MMLAVARENRLICAIPKGSATNPLAVYNWVSWTRSQDELLWLGECWLAALREPPEPLPTQFRPSSLPGSWLRRGRGWLRLPYPSGVATRLAHRCPRHLLLGGNNFPDSPVEGSRDCFLYCSVLYDASHSLVELRNFLSRCPIRLEQASRRDR